MKRIIVLFYLLWSLQMYAQKLHFVYEDTVEVFVNSTKINNPWSGAFQAPQFSSIDVNGDAKKDLFVFDRYDNSVSIFINENNTYKYKPDYDSLFPSMSGWVLLRDYNCDGKEDIFTSNAGGVAVYENTTVGDVVSFVKTTSFITSTSGPILVPFSDMPSIEDVDFDGDLDILTFDGGGTYVVFYKNTLVENGTSCSLLKFDVETICWGDFREGGLNNSITLNDNCGGGIASHHDMQDKNIVHSGSSLLAFDNDGDNDMDLVIGDISANNLVFLRNGNDKTNAIMDNVIDSFPVSKPVNLPLYVASYFIDVDFDGKRDFLAVPNEGAEASGKNFDQIIKYKNTGTDATPIFTFESDDFLANTTIELGSGTIPSFLDYDLDGDLDLIVGNFAYRSDASNSTNKLALFENTGTKQLAKYELVTDDFVNTSLLGLYSTSPTFGDLDADGDIDMMLGEFSGKLYYFKNIAGVGNSVNFILDSAYYGGIDVGSNSTPFLIDIDNDNDLDLVIGERNGNVNLFENTGDSTNPNFALKTDSLGKILEVSALINAGYTVPYVIDFDKDDKLDLALGTYDGNVRFFSNIEDNINKKVEPISNTYYNSKTTHFGNVNYGKRSAPAISDLNNDGFLDMVMGVYRGGLIYFRNESDPNLGLTNNTFSKNNFAYPNPFHNSFTLRTTEHLAANYQIFNNLGELIMEGKTVGNETKINFEDKTEGIYFLILRKEDKIVLNHKLIKLK